MELRGIVPGSLNKRKISIIFNGITIAVLEGGHVNHHGH
jgi:hypothetical protein